MSQELLQGLGSVKPNGTSVIRQDDCLLFTGNVWPSAIIPYIPITDCTHTFEYDFEYESEAGNYFYIGIERFNEDKATGSNNSTIYQVSTANSAKTRQRVRGTVNLDQVIANNKKTAYIRLRILNNWTNSSGTNVTAKIYKLSVREIMETGISVTKLGQLQTDTIWENFTTASFNKLDVVESNNFYEY